MGKYFIHNGNLYSSDELYHYGVKGMKWGVRRTSKQLGQTPGRKNRQRTVVINGRKIRVGRADYLVDYGRKFAEEQIRKETTGKAFDKRIDALLDWEQIGWDNVRQYAKDICKDVIKTCKNNTDRHKHLSRLSSVLDSTVHDDPSVMAVDKQTGRMRYNSCVKFSINGVDMDSKTGKYNARELDKILNEAPDSMYYYVWGELQNND